MRLAPSPLDRYTCLQCQTPGRWVWFIFVVWWWSCGGCGGSGGVVGCLPVVFQWGVPADHGLKCRRNVVANFWGLFLGALPRHHLSMVGQTPSSPERAGGVGRFDPSTKVRSTPEQPVLVIDFFQYGPLVGHDQTPEHLFFSQPQDRKRGALVGGGTVWMAHFRCFMAARRRRW